MASAAFTQGIPHPPGYPLYTLIGRWLVRLPIGSTPAYRLGFLSSLPAAATVALFFWLALKIADDWLPALIASLSLAFNYLFWYQAEVQEVFMIHTFFLFLSLFLAWLWLKKPSFKLVLLLALIAGLEFGHHHTFVLVLPALGYLLFSCSKIKNLFKKKPLLKGGLVLACLSGGIFLYLILFYSTDPLSPVNWAFGQDLPALVRLIFRSNYGTFSPMKGARFSFSGGFLALLGLAHFIYFEFTLVGLFLMVVGFVWWWQKNQVFLRFSLIWFGFTGVFFLFYAGYPLSNWFSMATVERFYLLSYPVFFLWLIGGLEWIKARIAVLKIKADFKRGLLLLFLAYPLFLFFLNLKKNDYRHFWQFDRFGERLLNSCPAEAVFLNGGDLQTFASLYAQYVKGVRPDLKMISLFNPARAIFHLEELSQFRNYFEVGAQPREEFWPDFKTFLKEKRFPVCSAGEISLGEDYLVYPRGLVYVHALGFAPDIQTIFADNEKLWNEWKPEIFVTRNSLYETFFNRQLLDLYYQKAFSLSEFFFLNNEFEKTRSWLEKALWYQPNSASVLRTSILVDIKTGQCQEAESKISRFRLLFEKIKSWPLIEAVYEKECLGKEEKYQQLSRDLGMVEASGSSEMAEGDKEEKIHP